MPDSLVDPQRLEELLDYCLESARQMIEEQGTFDPFGAIVTAQNELAGTGVHLKEENPKGYDVIRLLQKALQDQFARKRIIAAAIVANVTIPPQFKPPFPDGIRVLLECASFARFIYLPYRISEDRVEYGEFIAVEVSPVLCGVNPA